MPKTIKVSLLERVRLADIVGSQEASCVQQQRQLIGLLEAIELSAAESAAVGLVVDHSLGRITWDPAKAEGATYEVALPDSYAVLLAAILSNEGGRYRVALRVRDDAWAPRILDELRGGAA